MISWRGLFSTRSDARPVRKVAGTKGRGIRQGLELLEGRLLLNSHPAGAVPHHIHPHLAIFIDGQNFEIPASVGHTTPGPIRGTPNENAHTHTTDGIIHYNEATAAFRDLKEFFDTWGAVFNQNQIKLPTAYNASGQPTQFLERNVDATHSIRFFVNGAASSDFEQYEPEDGDQMVISYETIPAAGAPQLNPINNVTMASNPGAGAPSRTIQVPLDGTSPNGSPLTYTVTTSNPNITATLAPASNRFLKLNVSGRDIDNVPFTGDLIFQLSDDVTPATVGRIVQLVQTPKTSGTGNFYDGVKFHRIVNDFMAQGGDPSGNGTGGSGVRFNDEFNAGLTFDGFAQLAMANSGDDTNDSQFFITDSNLSLFSNSESPNVNPPRSLNFQHSVFGQLVSGFETFNKMMLTPVHVNPSTGERSVPDNDVIINNASIINDTSHRVLRLTAPANFTGSSTITVTAANSTGQTAQRSFVTTAVSDSLNDRAFLGNISNASTRVNTPITITLPATDLENDTLSFVVRDPNNFNNVPANVSVSIDQANRRATLTPATGFSGTINLLVGVRDGTRRVDTNGDGQITTTDTLDVRGNFDTQVIQLTVSNSNLAPTANAQTVNYQANTPVNITLTGDDGDADATQALTFIVNTVPAGGTLRDSNQNIVAAGATLPSPNLTYTPTAGSTANDQFTFHVKDNGGTANGGQDTSAVATVSLRTQVNRSPTADAQTIRFRNGAATSITLTGGDGDADVTQTISFVVDSLPAQGTLRDSNNNVVTVGATLPSATVSFTPNAGFTGTTNFRFHVRDNGGTANGGDDTSDSATITLRGFGDTIPAPAPRMQNDVLVIQGTKGDDIVEVEMNAAGTMIEVSVNGATVTQFAVNGTNRIRIRTGAGGDEVTVTDEVELSARIWGGQGDDILEGGSGDDVIRGRRGVDEIIGGDGDDRLFGGRDDDDISGDDGNDRIRGRRGDDAIDGGDGDDFIRAGSGDDEVDAGDGTDTVRGGIGDDDIQDAERTSDSDRVASMVAERALNSITSLEPREDEEPDDAAIASMTADSLIASLNQSLRTAARHEDLVDAVIPALS